MTFVQDLEAKFVHVKANVEGDLHSLVLKLESIFQRIHQVEVSGVLKQAVSTDIHTALEHVAVVADSVRAKADVVDAVVDSADSKLDAVVEADPSK